MMPDLEHKFETLQAQLATQNTGIQNSLDAILTALGAPPPTATTTLATVVTALAAMQAAQLTQHNALMSVLGLINTNTDTIINNNSLNMQRLISAILSTACPCTTTAPLLPMPIDVTPTTLADDAKCRRIQFYLHLFGSWLTKIGNYGGAGAFVTGDVLGTLLGLAAAESGIVATVAEGGTIFGPPGTVIGAVVGLIVGAVGIFGASVLTDYANQFNDSSLQAALLAALYAENNASAGQTAFETVVGAHISTVPAAIISALWWVAWSNDMYASTPVVPDSMFNGSICAPAPVECHDFNSSAITMTTGSNTVNFQAVVWPNDTIFPAISATGGTTGSAPIWSTMDLFGWRIRCTTGATTVYLNTSQSHSLGSDVWTCDVHTTLMSMVSGEGANFSVEMCIPLL